MNKKYLLVPIVILFIFFSIMLFPVCIEPVQTTPDAPPECAREPYFVHLFNMKSCSTNKLTPNCPIYYKFEFIYDYYSNLYF